MKILIHVLVFILTLLGANSIYSLIRQFTFTIPFSKKCLSVGAIENKSIMNQLIIVDMVSPLFTVVVFLGIASLLAFKICLSARITFVITLLSALVFKPTKDRYTMSDYTIAYYLNKHAICLDMKKLGLLPEIQDYCVRNTKK